MSSRPFEDHDPDETPGRADDPVLPDVRASIAAAHSRVHAGAELGPDVGPALARQVESIVTAAERAASEFRRDVEAHSNQQAAELRESAEAEAIRIRREALTDAQEYATSSRRRVDQFASERIARLSTLTDELIGQAESVERQFDVAEDVRRQIYSLITAIGTAAERVAVVAEEHGPHISAPPWEQTGGHEPDSDGEQDQ